jgi:hypothetical protein
MIHKAVIVGISYEGELHLPSASHDAWAVYHSLIDEYGFAEEDIYMLVQSSEATPENSPSKENILKGNRFWAD